MRRMLARPVGSAMTHRSHDLPVLAHSHSMVAGGLELMSYTTRLTPGTSLTIRAEIFPRTSYGSFAPAGGMPSPAVPARIATTFAYVRPSPMTPTERTGVRMAN